jgi:hypothetical protein
LAAEFDTSIDDDIRKNYNPSKIEDDMALPTLPKIMNESKTTSTIPVNNQVTKSTQITKIQPDQISQPAIQQIFQQTNIPEAYYAVIKQGKKVEVRLMNNISDSSKKGTRVTFVSKYPVTTTCYTIPTGTIFKGEIIDSHRPQLSGNGGLIVIRIDSVILNNKVQPINAVVTKADSKHIFFNNIKGKRKYISSMLHSTRPGFHFFGKMIRVTANLATDGSSIVVAPFSLFAGCVAVVGNVLAAPVVAVFHKGDSIQILAGKDFELKFSQDVFIYN